MTSLKAPITLTDGINVRYFSNSVLRIALIQLIFGITISDLYLQGLSKSIYLPNFQGEFPETSEDILFIQPTANNTKTDEIIVNITDTRFIYSGGDWVDTKDYLITGYNVQDNYAARSFIKFDKLDSLKGKKILKVYLYLTGKGRNSKYFAEPEEVFVYRILEKYGNIIRWTEMPKYNPNPLASIIVRETYEEIFSIDVTSLVVNWIDGSYPNFGLMLKGNDEFGVQSSKAFLRTSEPPYLRVICLP